MLKLLSNESCVLSWIILDAKENILVDLKFALPWKEQQDSVYSGLEVNRFFNFWYLTFGAAETKSIVCCWINWFLWALMLCLMLAFCASQLRVPQWFASYLLHRMFSSKSTKALVGLQALRGEEVCGSPALIREREEQFYTYSFLTLKIAYLGY